MFRLSGWLVAAIIATLLVLLLAPQQLPVTLYKFSLLASAAVAGYWLDRSMFPEARTSVLLINWRENPETFNVIAFSAAMIRKSLIVSAAMLTIGMGA